MNKIYCEHQRGGLCRLHAINAFFGGPQISEAEFKQYAKEMDLLKSKYDESNCLEFDSVSSNHNMLVTYILKKFGYVTRYLPISLDIGSHKRRACLHQNIEDLVCDFFFIYNSNHIWGARRVSDVWYIVDSISGVRRASLASMESANTGFIIPVDAQAEFRRNVTEIRGILDCNNVTHDVGAISLYISEINAKGLILGDLEVPLSLTIDILETTMKSKPRGMFAPVLRLISSYHEFLGKFNPANYHNEFIKLEYIPEIIMTLMRLKK